MSLTKINGNISNTINTGIKDIEIKRIEILRSIDTLKNKLIKSDIQFYFIEEYLEQLNNLEAELIKLDFYTIENVSKLYVIYKHFGYIQEDINKKFKTNYNTWNVNFNKRLFYIIIPFLITLLYQLYNDKQNILFIDYIRLIISNIYIIFQNTINDVVLESTKNFIKNFINVKMPLGNFYMFDAGNIDTNGDVKNILHP